ncbi:MAG: pectinesterase family protein [Prevotella sp.]|nr:pectinesterase family protein [Prevotella sp.]
MKKLFLKGGLLFLLSFVACLAKADNLVALWDFHNDNPSGILSQAAFSEGSSGYITSTIDTISMFVDCTQGGKFVQDGDKSHVQINSGTILQVPVYNKGDIVSVTRYPGLLECTIGGQDVEFVDDVATYTASKDDANQGYAEIVSKGSYLYAVQVEYVEAVVATVNSDMTATWVFNTGTEGQVATFTPDGISSYIKQDYVTLGSILSYAGTQTYELNGISTNYTKIEPASKESGADDATNAIDFVIVPKTGLTFTPTQVSFNALRCGTDGGAMDIYWLNSDGTKVSLATGQVAGRENNSTENANYEFSYDVTDATGSTGACGLHINLYNLGSDNSPKQYAFANIVITGTLSGTMEDVAEYTLTTSVSPEGAGTVKNTPNGTTFDDGDKVTLTQTRNFGYQFVNWTDADGKEVSTDESCVITMDQDQTITANYEAVTTYSLTVEMDESGANDYMVSLDPEATVIDGKNMYEEGTPVTLTASSNKILTFASWSNGETSASTTVTMNQDQTIGANYSAVDYIAGWDFYKSGNSGRVADFYAADNDADALVLRTDDGTTSAWLDKSEEAAGGYEGKPAAVNWKTTGLGDYYWQTKVNAEAFTDIKVSSSMMYNYNAYTKYDVQYSLDGTEWTTVGSIEMSRAKNWTTEEFSLGSDADNQSAVYIRWYPDKTSTIDGSTSDNDGSAIAEIFITGTENLVDDGTAPELVSSVPEEGATTASANGKIVLTFDEKVKLVSDDVTATLGDMTLTPTVSGKTVMFTYKGLSYSTEYTFKLPGNSISDLTNNAISDAITITFTTKTKPTVTKQLFDFIVPDNGSIEEAIAAANSRSNTSDRYRIFVKQAEKDYVIPASTTATIEGGDGNYYPSPITTLSAPNVSIIGEDRDATSIVNTVPEETYIGDYGEVNVIEGLSKCETFSIESNAKNTYFQDITIKNGLPDGMGRGAAIQDQSDRTICMNVCLYGYQDTYLSNSITGRFYFEGGKLRGRTDFLCGKGDVYYNAVELVMCESGGYLAVPSTPTKYGYIFRDCTINGEGSGINGNYTLGRPWGSGTPIALYINTTMNVQPSAIGWSEMSGGWPARFAEYNSMTSTGTVIDLSNRKTTFGDGYTNDPVLTEEEAALYTLDYVLGGDDDWDPTDATEQASAPQNVVISGKSLTWDNSDYVLCWAICQDGKVIGFTTENSYTVDDTSATYSVRAANEMGGLGEATTATESTGIKEIENVESGAVLRTSFYNQQGARVSNSYKGVVIKVDTMSDGKQVATKIIK